MNNTNDLFIVVKASVEPATLFRWVDNKRMSQHASGFKSKFFLLLDWFTYQGWKEHSLLNYLPHSQWVKKRRIHAFHSEEKRKQPRTGFDLTSSSLFPTKINIMLSATPDLITDNENSNFAVTLSCVISTWQYEFKF